MLATFQALAVFLTTVLPGVLFTLAFERENDRTATAEFNERLLAFFATSALFAAISAPLLYQGYRSYIVTGKLKSGDPLPGWVWGIVAAYVVVPLLVGGIVGRRVRKRAGEANGFKAGVWRTIGGPLASGKPDPRAWERLFYTPDLIGYVKLKLKDSGTANPWVCGVWAHPDANQQVKRPGSYVSGYPYDQDAYFYDTCQIDDQGVLITTPSTAADGTPTGGQIPVRTGVAVLIRWDEVAYAEFIEV